MRGRSRRLEALCRNSSFFIRFGPIFRSSGDEDERGRKVRPETVDPISLRSREFSPSSPPLHPLHEPFQRVANFMAPVGSLRAARLPPRRINTSIKIKNLQPKITSNCYQSGAGEPARSSPRRRALAGGLVPTPGDMPMPFSLLPLLLAFSTPSSHPGHQNPIRSKSRIFAAPPEPVSRRRRNQRPHDLQRRRPHCPRVLSLILRVIRMRAKCSLETGTRDPDPSSSSPNRSLFHVTRFLRLEERRGRGRGAMPVAQRLPKPNLFLHDPANRPSESS